MEDGLKRSLNLELFVGTKSVCSNKTWVVTRLMEIQLENKAIYCQ
jgi:hypothetical protein